MWSGNEKTTMRLEQDLVDDWELQDAWPLTRPSDELREGYTWANVKPWGVVSWRTFCIYIPLRLVGAMVSVQVLLLGV